MDSLTAVVPTVVSLLLYGVMSAGFGAGMRRLPPPARAQPRVSILKPLAGLDEDLAENIASFAAIDWPDFEILLGVASALDPAAPVARAFIAAHPGIRARLVVTAGERAHNPKVAQLMALERASTGEVLVISDSNVRVAPQYLYWLVAELSRPGVGLASSVVAGTGERSIGAALENLQLAAVIAPGVMASQSIAGKALTVGKSMAMWRRDLAAVGGLQRVGGVLAEDFVLGRIFARAGLGVRVSPVPVENRNVGCSVRRTLERHTRWAKMRRAIAPIGFALEPVLCPIVVATLALLLSPSRETAAALGITASLQTSVALLTMRRLRGRALPWRLAPLEALRSYLLFYCWLRACASRRVVWRGHELELGPDSSITPATVTPEHFVAASEMTSRSSIMPRHDQDRSSLGPAPLGG